MCALADVCNCGDHRSPVKNGMRNSPAVDFTVAVSPALVAAAAILHTTAGKRCKRYSTQPASNAACSPPHLRSSSALAATIARSTTALPVS
jgi:hypothetical protein